MREKGDRVRWNAVSSILNGVLEGESEPGDWLVRLDSGKFVIVNEKSFIDG